MELVKTWENDGFVLRVYDLNKTDSMGKSVLGYTLEDKEWNKIQGNSETFIFAGVDFHCSPLHSVDSDETIVSLLGFLAIGEHDTDSEYFDNYTNNQLAWRDSERREILNYLVNELEEAVGYC